MSNQPVVVASTELDKFRGPKRSYLECSHCRNDMFRTEVVNLGDLLVSCTGCGDSKIIRCQVPVKDIK